MADSRTPALVMCGVAAVNIVSGLVLATVLPDRDRAIALALSFALAYAIGASICFRLLHETARVGRWEPRILRTVVRALVAGVMAAAIAYAHLRRDPRRARPWCRRKPARSRRRGAHRRQRSTSSPRGA